MFLLLAAEAMCINTELQTQESFLLPTIVWYNLPKIHFSSLCLPEFFAEPQMENGVQLERISVLPLILKQFFWILHLGTWKHNVKCNPSRIHSYLYFQRKHNFKSSPGRIRTIFGSNIHKLLKKYSERVLCKTGYSANSTFSASTLRHVCMVQCSIIETRTSQLWLSYLRYQNQNIHMNTVLCPG